MTAAEKAAEALRKANLVIQAPHPTVSERMGVCDECLEALAALTAEQAEQKFAEAVLRDAIENPAPPNDALKALMVARPPRAAEPAAMPPDREALARKCLEYADAYAGDSYDAGVEIVFREVAALLLRPSPADRWRPIKSAPKDKSVLIAEYAGNRWHILEAYYLKRGRRKGAWFAVDNGDEEFSQPYNPTHWCPLPAPPSSETEQR